MSIRLRITLLVILTFMAISSIGGYAVFQSRSNALEVKSVTEGVVPSALASADLVSQLKSVQLAAMVIVYAPDEQTAAQASELLAAKRTKLQGAFDLQAKLADSVAQQGLMAQANESLVNYFTAIDGTVKTKNTGNTDIAQALFFGTVVQYQFELEQIIETLRIEKNRSKDQAIAALNENLATTTTAISVVTIFAALFLTAAGMLLYRRIIGPISQMQTMMTEIAASQDFTRRVPVDRMDEIGRSTVAFNGMIEKIQESSAQLAQKTTDIQAMLHHIPQGILTVVSGNKIHPEYSDYLETLFETTDIAGRDLMALVFSDTTLGGDVLSQADAVTGACIGEDVMNFAFNQHLMVTEIEKTMPDGRVKILDLSWSPITDTEGMIVRLMLCVRDVTQLRQLAAESNEQRRELEIVGEILMVSQDKFHAFIVGSLQFIDENEQIIRAHPQANEVAIARLFRNMHTIKGNGRTYGLLHLANIVHDAEQSYDALRNPHTAVVWDQRALVDELDGVKIALERYAKINEVVLGRKGPGSHSGMERYLMIDKKHIQESLQRLETVNTANLQEMVSVRNAVRQTLRLLGTERLGDALSSVLASLPALAAELGKDAPLTRIDDGGYVVHNQTGGMLTNVFMHLIRNAMDHGLETPAVRSTHGKPTAGTIDLQMTVVDDHLQITLSDDGGGLALGRIRDIAMEKGLDARKEIMTDEEIARLILHAGFSTSATVTQVSGRGVGMDAVQDFITRANGRIEIAFTDDAVGADFRQFQTIVFLPASVAVHVSDTDAHLFDGSGYPLPTPVSVDAKASMGRNNFLIA